jgi:hypothetical protein
MQVPPAEENPPGVAVVTIEYKTEESYQQDLEESKEERSPYIR